MKVIDRLQAFREKRRLLRLVLIGAVSEAIYLIYVLLYPLYVHAQAERPFDLEQLSRGRPWAALIYAAGLAVLFGAFWVALRLTRRAEIPTRWVIAFGLLFGLTLVWLYPVTATDLFQYVLRARVRVVYGANPMAVPASNFPEDPLLPFAGEWADSLSPYGPAWELLAEGGIRLGARDAVSGALMYKGVALISYLICTGLLAWGTQKNSQAILFFAWNPLVLLEGLGNGHNDVLMLSFVVLAFLLWERKRLWIPAVVTLSLAVLIKFSAALAAPLLMVAILRNQQGWMRRSYVLVVSGVLALGVVILTYLPFWPPWESIAGILDEFSHRCSYTIVALLRMILREFIPADLARSIARAIGQIVFLGLYLFVLMRLWKRRIGLVEAGVYTYFVYLLAASSYRIWYPLWLVPLASLCLTPRTRLRIFLLCLTSEFSILMFYLVWRWGLAHVFPRPSYWLVMHALTIPWQFGLPLLLPLRLPRDG